MISKFMHNGLFYNQMGKKMKMIYIKIALNILLLTVFLSVAVDDLGAMQKKSDNRQHQNSLSRVPKVSISFSDNKKGSDLHFDKAKLIMLKNGNSKLININDFTLKFPDGPMITAKNANSSILFDKSRSVTIITIIARHSRNQK